MSSAFWAKAHGAATHFPVALALSSAVFDAAGLALARRPAGPGLQAAGYWTMLAGALATVPAVISGLCMTRGIPFGHDLLRLHHLFVWPAFSLLIGLAAWRTMTGPDSPRKSFAVYLGAVGAAVILLSVAAYWGGEMMLAR